MSANFEHATGLVAANAVASSTASISAAGGVPIKRDKSKEARMTKKGTQYLQGAGLRFTSTAKLYSSILLDWAALHGLNPTTEEKDALVAGVKVGPCH
jgi:hypothetical protein